MPKTPARAARIAIAVTFAVAATLGTSGCSFATLDGVNPGDGVNTTSNGVHIMNVVLVGTAAKARVVGSVQTPVDDTLVSVGGAPLTDNGAAAAYAPAAANIALKANQLVVLDGRHLTLTSSTATEADQTAQVTFTFQKAGAITVTAPIMSASDPVYSASPSAQG